MPELRETPRTALLIGFNFSGFRGKKIDDKPATEETVYSLDFSQKTASTDKYQVDQLKENHAPEQGPHCAYIQYAAQIPFVPAVEIDKLKLDANPRVLNANLGDHGARFAEWLVERTIIPAYSEGGTGVTTGAGAVGDERGGFSGAAEIIDFIMDASDDAPCVVVSLFAGWAPQNELVSGALEDFFNSDKFKNRKRLKPKQVNSSRSSRQEVDTMAESTGEADRAAEPGESALAGHQPGDLEHALHDASGESAPGGAEIPPEHGLEGGEDKFELRTNTQNCVNHSYVKLVVRATIAPTPIHSSLAPSASDAVTLCWPRVYANRDPSRIRQRGATSKGHASSY